MELMGCPDLAVPMDVMQHVVRVESSNNPYAIGVVGGHLVRQPANLPEALATARMLESRGFNFSLGLAQVNRYNLARYGLDYARAFQACPNLQAGSRILAECHARSGRDWGKSFSCYYSGNFVTGYRHGYVQKIFASMGQAQAGAAPIDVVPAARRATRARARADRHLASTPSRIDPTAPSRFQSTLQPLPTPVAAPSNAAAPAAVTPPANEVAVLNPAGRGPQLVQGETARNAIPQAAATASQPPRDDAFVF